jgi:peptidyl-tRNA hydrolase
MYALLRQDLGMTPGKSASQAGHAYLESFVKTDRSISLAYLNQGGTKIALAAPDLQTLEQIHAAALAADLPCAIVVESGHVMPPTFDGSPIITALGIGPVDREIARPLVRKLRLMQ